jgi:ABC-type branched-subunit amino acid transport system permease subunit
MEPPDELSPRVISSFVRNRLIDQVYLPLTFITLAMLVVGGVSSLWGAVVGALAVSALDSFLSQPIPVWAEVLEQWSSAAGVLAQVVLRG